MMVRLYLFWSKISAIANDWRVEFGTYSVMAEDF